MKKTFLFFLFSILTFAQEDNLKSGLDNLLEADFFEGTGIAISVYDLENDSLLYAKNENLLLHPASNMKILTSATALHFLGDSAFFSTVLYHTGVIKDSILWGDIIVKGGCDPDFETADLSKFAGEIKNLGIKEIRGNLLGDISMLDSVYWGKGWMWDDNPYTDFPQLTPLILNKNLIDVIYSPIEIHKPVDIKLYPENDLFIIENNSKVTVKEANSFTVTRDWINNKNKIIANGEIAYLNFEDTTYLNLVDANLFFLNSFKHILIKNGINFKGKAGLIKGISDKVNKIAGKKNYIKDMIVNLNKKSDNLSAEMLLRLLGAQIKKQSVSASDGIRFVDSLITLASPGSKYFRVVDGSGVSHYNLVTAKILNDVLNFIYRHDKYKFEILKKSFPVSGTDGTLKNRMKEIKGKVFAKTGTLSGVSTLSGYIKTLQGKLVSFSILVQNYVGSSKTARDYQDEICKIIFESL